MLNLGHFIYFVLKAIGSSLIKRARHVGKGWITNAHFNTEVQEAEETLRNRRQGSNSAC